RHTGVLAYWPLPGEDMTAAEVVAPRRTRGGELKGAPELGLWVEKVTFRGLSFQHEDWELEPEGHSDPQAVVSAPAAIMADGALDCTFERCEVARVGHYGIWLRRACKRCRIVQCRIRDLGIGGVRIGEASMPKTEALTSSHNVVDNCHLFDGGHVYPAGVGIWVAQSHHNRITHNDIHDFNYSGMSIGWNWNDAANRTTHNLIERNHVHHVMKGQLNDGGAIYTLGTSPGSAIRHNLFHDVWPHSAIGWGIYLDSTTNGYLVENNVVYNILSGGLMKHNGGHNNVIRNNVFAFSAQQMLWPCWSKDVNTFERNIVFFTQGTLFIPMAERRLRERLKEKQSLGVWDRNVFWNPAQPDFRFFKHTFAEWQKMGLDAQSVVADPMFVDADGCDFRLKPGSPALKLGFQPIDVSETGLYGDPAWVAEAKAVRHPKTVLPDPPPPPGPKPVDDGFEDTPVGGRPVGALVSGEMGGASIVVTDEAAATGKRSLKITDSSAAKPSWQPHFYYQPHFTEGTVRQSFRVLLRPGCSFFTEWRDETGYPGNIGPSVRLDGHGNVTASGRKLATVPVGKWVRVDIECALGQKGKGAAYTVTLTVPGSKPQRFENLRFSGDDFHAVHWLGFVSIAESDTVFFLDDIQITQAK
ncbi:MAG: right-handed parallel beta-helix repeat-containing protein, partial [Candidatus Brocadiae bacterium]|nr:right-handed parallel beta-helix repeat-containing protein [Candidatus Brocadiia bacterium]